MKRISGNQTRGFVIFFSIALLALACFAGGAYAAGVYTTMANSAVSDVVGHFWTGTASAGNIIPTWGGYNPPPNGDDQRGSLWERGTMYFAMADLWQTTHDTTLQQRCQADWNHTKSAFTLNELTTCGVGWQSTGCDDSAWDCYMYIEAYLVTGDSYALQCAQTLAGNMFSRWYDSALGGGMWYRDARDFKSLYQAPSIMDYIKLYEITGTKSYLTHALLCYTWVEKRELRSFDNLYWCDYNSAGPVGASTPYDIGQAGSVCFIGGEMTMAAVHARLYRDLGDDIYRVRALRTIAAIRNRYLDSHGVLINDRDAWADGSFVGEYAREALSLPGVNPTDVTALKNTATAIFNNDRTSTGYYGGCWDGPVGTSGDVWSNVGSTPQQIMTSANSINMICAAANLP